MEKNEIDDEKNDIFVKKVINLQNDDFELNSEKEAEREQYAFDKLLSDPSPDETIELPPTTLPDPYIEPVIMEVEKPKSRGRHLSTILREAITTIKNSEGQTLDTQIALALAEQAADGNLAAISMVFDRIDGKPQQEIDINAGGTVQGLSAEHRAKLDILLNNTKI